LVGDPQEDWPRSERRGLTRSKNFHVQLARQKAVSVIPCRVNGALGGD